MLRQGSLRVTGLAWCVLAVVCTVLRGPAVRADIEITEDDWEKFTELGTEPGIGNAATPPPRVVETDDGRLSLYFSGDPDDNLAYVTYIVNVTQLPGGGPGPERFPITLEARHAEIGGMVIRNLTVDPIPASGFQNQASFAAVMIRATEADIFALGTGEQPFDPCVDLLDRDEGFDIVVQLWSSVGIASANATLATDNPSGATGIVRTVNVMLDLVEGENIVRIDTGDLRNFPCDPKGESGHQLFALTIGEGENDLKGEVITKCSARRALSASRYSPGDTVTVTLAASNISGATTITDTFPAGWTVSDAGGGTVNGNEISLSVTGDGDVSYKLDVPDGFCDSVVLSGKVEGPGCSGDVSGAANLSCFEVPRGTSVFTFDGEPGPTETAELNEFFLFLGVDKPGWTIDPNRQNRDNDTRALHSSSDGEELPIYFSRVALIREDVFEAENVFFSADITWDDQAGDANDHAGIYFRFAGDSDDPFLNNFYFVRIYAQNRGVHLHRVRDGFEETLVADAPQPTPVNEGDTAVLAVRADGGEIFVTLDDVPVAGLDPFIDEDPLEDSGLVGVGQNTNPSYFDNLAFADLDAGPAGASLKPGDTNGDGGFNISDPVAHLNFLFAGGVMPECYTVAGSDPVEMTASGLAVLDFNGDGAGNIADAVGALNFLFGGGGPHVLGEGCAEVEGDCVASCR